MPDTILIVDDEKEIADLVEMYLKNEGLRVLKAYTAAGALELIGSEDISLALLDVMLPDMDGFELCAKIRAEHLFPVIMLTARTAGIDKINGLAIGADDYITKPFDPLEVAARVKTQLRRFTQYDRGELSPSGDVHAVPEYDRNGLYVCPSTHICTLYGRKTDLTPTEFSILWYLCERHGRVVPAEELFEAVWGEKYLNSNNTVMAHIARLREKLNEPPRKPRFIKTVWGVGYKIDS